jgi:RCR-type E3 ubiquitin transferase
VEGLSQAPSIRLECGHSFHAHCARERIERKWPGKRITFGFLACPLCKTVDMIHSHLDKARGEVMKLYDDIAKRSRERLVVESMENDPKLKDKTSPFYGNPTAYGLASFAFYPCWKCKKPFFGGKRDCEQNAEADHRVAQDFICLNCSDLHSAKGCKKAEHAGMLCSDTAVLRPAAVL